VKDVPQDFSGHHEMKLWASEMPLSCQLQKSYTKFNNKLNSLQMYDIAQNYRIIHVVQRLSQHNLKISIFRRFVKENNDSNKASWNVHDLLMYQNSVILVQTFINWLHKRKH
jgi:hypothetical protein